MICNHENVGFYEVIKLRTCKYTNHTAHRWNLYFYAWLKHGFLINMKRRYFKVSYTNIPYFLLGVILYFHLTQNSFNPCIEVYI